MVVMRAVASVDDNTAPRLSCAIIGTAEILREKAGICKLEASHAANDWSATPASGIAAVRSGDTGRDCPCRFAARPRLSDTELGPSTVIVSAVYANHYLDTQFGGGEWEPLQRCLSC